MADSLEGLGENTTIFEFSPDWSVSPGEEKKIQCHFQIEPGTVADVRFFRSPQRILNFSLSDFDTKLYPFLIFFADRIGRYKNFWFVDWAIRFIPLEIDISLWYLDIEKNSLLYFNGKERFFISMKNGDRISRVIASFSQETTCTRIVFESMLPEIEIEDIDYCSFIFYGRLNQDAIEIQYHGMAASCSLEFFELENEYPEH